MSRSRLQSESRRRLRLSTLAALALALSLGCGGPPFHGFVVDPPTPASSLRLPDGGGGQFDLKDERGRAVLVYFGYTCCPDICPRTLTVWAQARRLLGPRAERVRFVFVSVDPGRDP